MFINCKFLNFTSTCSYIIVSPTRLLCYTVTRKWNCIACPIGATTAASSDSSLKSAEETLTTIEDIEIEFAIMTDKIKQALINTKINVDSLIEQLRSISGVKNRKVPLFDEEVFTKIKSVEELWKTLSIFWSIYDYDILRFIIKITKCEDAKRVLENFLSRIDPTVIEDVDLVLHCRVEQKEGLPNMCKLRIKINAKKCTYDIKENVKEIISKAYDLQQYTLCFKSIKEGCIELLFYISKEVMTYLLHCKITARTLTKFSDCKIINIFVNEIDILVSN